MDASTPWDLPGFGTDPAPVPLENIREAARRFAAQTSLRTLARAVGVSPATARRFLDGAEPYRRGRALWEQWYAREHHGARAVPRRALPRGDGPAHSPAPPGPGGVHLRGFPAPHDVVVMRLDSARRAFPSDADLADVLGVDRAQPARWRAGEAPDPDDRARIVALDAVAELLSCFLGRAYVPRWLNRANPHLANRRPAALLRAGDLSAVIAAIEAERRGSVE